MTLEEQNRQLRDGLYQTSNFLSATQQDARCWQTLSPHQRLRKLAEIQRQIDTQANFVSQVLKETES